jgi:hypothetical protein
MSNLQQTPYLREQRNFPAEDAQKLQIEVDKMYIDVAQKVNSRIVGTFSLGNSVVTGETWYLAGAAKKQQSLRQVYTFTSTSNIAHGVTLSQIDRFTCMYGSFTDGTNWYGLIAGSSTAITGQISFYITPTDIVFVVDGAAPSLTSGTIVLQWLALP